MPIKILMPALSPTMEEGNLSKWKVKEGDTVKAGDVIAEIETDKATMEVEAVDEGVVGKIVIAGGTQGVKVNQVIAVLLEDGEKEIPTGFLAEQARTLRQAQGEENKKSLRTAPTTKQMARDMDDADEKVRVFISPLARRLAKGAGLNIFKLRGTGPGGRIIKADIEDAMKQGGTQTLRQAQGEGVGRKPAGHDNFDTFDPPPKKIIPHNQIRKIVASKLTAAKQDVPHFYLTVDIQIDGLLAHRQKLNDTLKKDGVKLSVNDFIVKAVANALVEVPAANAAYTEDGMFVYERADISVAVAIPDGLVTPIVRGANDKDLKTISQEVRALATKAKDNKLKPQDFQGGTFTVSNLGMFGIDHFGAIINPPQACILAVGQGVQKPVVKDGEIDMATVMTCTLSVDHRAVDGAVGAQFLAAFKKQIEQPKNIG